MYKLTFRQRPKTNMTRCNDAYSALFAAFHTFLIKNEDTHIALKPFMNDDIFISVDFFAESKSDLERLLTAVTRPGVCASHKDVEMFKFSFVISEPVLVDNTGTTVYMRKRTVDSYSPSKLSKKIIRILEGGAENAPDNSLNGSLKMLIDMLGVTKENLVSKIPEIKGRIQRQPSVPFVKVKSHSTAQDGILFGFRAVNLDEIPVQPNMKVNRYGLSTDEFVFPI